MTYETTPGTIAHVAVQHLRSLPLGTILSTAELAEAVGHESGTLVAYLSGPREHGLVVATTTPGERILRWELSAKAWNAGRDRAAADLLKAERRIDEMPPAPPPAAKPPRKPAPEDDETARRIEETLQPLEVPRFDGRLNSRQEDAVARLEPSIADAKPEVDQAPAAPASGAVPSPASTMPAGAVDAPSRADVPAPPPAVGAAIRDRWGVSFYSDGEFHMHRAQQSVQLDKLEFETLLDFLKRLFGENAA